MSFFFFRKPQALSDMQEHGERVVADVRELAVQAGTHFSALLQLLKMELLEYGACQVQRIFALAAGMFLLLVSYLALCVMLCVALDLWLGSWVLAVGIVCLLNALGGVSMLAVAMYRKPGMLAPATRQEIKDDLQCLKILLQPGKEKS